MDYFDFCVCFVEKPANRALAERLILEVSSYTLPKNVRTLEDETQYKKGQILALLPHAPLNNEQEKMLINCRWLMVICNNQDREVLSICQAINFFIINKGHQYILPILSEGEPQTAFPIELFKERKATITFSDGVTQEIVETIEPLAIDLRANDIKVSLSLLRHARIKIVAALINVSYDTLEQRHEKRTRRRLRLLVSILISVPIILGSVFTYLWINAEQKIDIAIKKTEISKDLLVNMCENYPLFFQGIPEIKPFVNDLLVNSIEKLRVVESEYIPQLNVENLLIPEDDDNLEQVRNKAKILRYLGKKENSKIAYKVAASKLELASREYEEMSSFFVEDVDPLIYPSGILVISIEENVSQACDGLSVGDLIVEAGGFKFRNQSQFEITIYNNENPNKRTKLTVLRLIDGELSLLTLSAKPKDLVFLYEEM